MSEDPYPEVEQQAARTAGSILRQTREQKGLSLEEAARVTRIAKGYLKALEDDCLDRLPNEAYAKGFLRAYARYLDLQAEELVVSLSPSVHDSGPHEEEAQSDADGAGVAQKPRAARRWLLALPALMLLCTLLIATSLFKRDESVPVPEASPAAHRTTTTAPLPPTAAQPVVAGGASNETRAASSDEIPFETPKSPTRGIILRLKAIEDGALDITIDNMISQHYDLRAGDLIEWKGEKVFVLDLQNAGGVEAEFNGRMMAPFGEKGMQAHVRLAPGGAGSKTAP